MTKNLLALLISIVFVGCSSSQENVQKDNRRPASEADRLQTPTFLTWLDHKKSIWTRDQVRSQSNPDPQLKWTELHNFPTPLNPTELLQRTGASLTRLRETVELYAKQYGRNSLESFLWSGLETGNNLTMDLSYRWDSIADAGLYDHDNRLRFVKALTSSGVRNLRMGMPNHLMTRNARGEWDEAGWKKFDDILQDFVQPCGESTAPVAECKGLRISLDLHHFGIEDEFRDPVDPKKPVNLTRSYYLNDRWPAYFADFAAEAYRRYHTKIKSITLINEPDTTAQFNAGFWHGAFPGFNADAPQYTVERAINIGKAAVMARVRLEAEQRRLQPGSPILFIHSEAAQSKPDDPDFVRFSRFFTSDLILGHPWIRADQIRQFATTPVTDADLQRLRDNPAVDSLSWALRAVVLSNRFVGPSGQKPYTARQKWERITRRLNEVRELHAQLEREFGVAMMDRTVFGLDYYMPNESFAAEINANVAGADKKTNVSTTPVRRMRHEPQDYADDIRAGIRRGLFPVGLDYFERYPMPMMIAETGTAFFHYLDLWAQQMMIDSGALAQSGIPFLGLTLYPTLDNWGWDLGKAMSRPKSESKVPLPSGIIWRHTEAMGPSDKDFGARDFEPKRGFLNFVRELKSVFPQE